MPGGAITSSDCGIEDTSISISFVEFALAQPLAELLPRRAGVVTRACGKPDIARWRQQDVEDPVLGGVLGAGGDLLHFRLAGLLDRHVDQVANDRVDIAADIADLGELRGFDLDEWGIGQPRKATRDLGLADTGRADQQDVLRRDLGTQRVGHLLAPPAVAQRDRNRTLRTVLADDVLVQFVNDFSGGHHGNPPLVYATAARSPVHSRRSVRRAALRRLGGGAQFKCNHGARSTDHRSRLQHLDRVLLVRVDAEVAGDRQRLLDQFRGSKLGVVEQRPRGSLCIGTPGANRNQSEFGLQDIAGACDDQRRLAVGNGQHRFQPAQDAIGSPILGQLDGRPDEIALVLLELGFEPLEQRERVGGCPGKAGQDSVLIEPPDLASRLLDDDVAQSHLAVAAHCNTRAAARGNDRRSVKVFHGDFQGREYGLDGGGQTRRNCTCATASIPSSENNAPIR
jgi:hypothetical protein